MRTLWVIVLALCSLPFLASAEDTRLTVQVNSVDTGKPIDRASVVVRFRHGLNVNMKKMITNWETKTNQDGKVSLPPMPHGEITVQVIAANYQTFGDVFQLTDPQQTISIKLNRPQAQYSEDAKTKK
ncbi:MAG: hypothetical protein QOJ99_2948 [Bryobacterales bacterium]|jgi:hypothetical protein|nr:hypothetical protein [Bryobacterales bacterium]